MSDKATNFAADRKYSPSHEWAKQEGELIVVGISDKVQDRLGDVVFVELPAVGTQVAAGKAFGVVESSKASSDLFSPISGTVEAINDQLANSPETVNKDAYGAGWLIKVRPSNPGELDKLLDAATYQKKIDSGEIH